MKDRFFQLHDGQFGAAITVRITPRSSRNEIGGILEDGTVNVCLTATQPVEQLNRVLISFLAEVLGIQPKQVEIVAGESGYDKLVTIMGMDKDSVQDRILAHIA